MDGLGGPNWKRDEIMRNRTYLKAWLKEQERKDLP
jgi:hypothetical protein